MSLVELVYGGITPLPFVAGQTCEETLASLQTLLNTNLLVDDEPLPDYLASHVTQALFVITPDEQPIYAQNFAGFFEDTCGNIDLPPYPATECETMPPVEIEAGIVNLNDGNVLGALSLLLVRKAAFAIRWTPLDSSILLQGCDSCEEALEQFQQVVPNGISIDFGDQIGISLDEFLQAHDGNAFAPVVNGDLLYIQTSSGYENEQCQWLPVPNTQWPCDTLSPPKEILLAIYTPICGEMEIFTSVPLQRFSRCPAPPSKCFVDANGQNVLPLLKEEIEAGEAVIRDRKQPCPRRARVTSINPTYFPSCRLRPARGEIVYQVDYATRYRYNKVPPTTYTQQLRFVSDRTPLWYKYFPTLRRCACASGEEGEE